MQSQPQRSQKFTEYYTVGAAAEFLGVSPWTLRNWDRAGKLSPRRHPKNGYRIYRHEDLVSTLEAECGRALGDVLAPPHANWKDMGESEHFVQLYETDEYLAESVAGYVAAALRAGDGAIVVATPAHRSEINARLAAVGLDVDARLVAGQYVCADAAETLGRFMAHGLVDPARFATVVGQALADFKSRHKRVRAFGEMVALLWADGNRAAALDLERRWDELQRRIGFSLFCAYPMNAFPDAADGQSLGDVCACHSRVVPAEDYAVLTTCGQRLRAIAAMQQRIRSLEAELARCRGNVA